MTVLPDLGGATISDLCPAPTGEIISIILDVKSTSGFSVSKLNFFSGYNGVKLSKFVLNLLFCHVLAFLSF